MGTTVHAEGMMRSALEHEPAGWDMILWRRVRTARSERPVFERCTVSSTVAGSVHRNVSPIFLVRSSDWHCAGSRGRWSATSVGRVGILAWGLALVVVGVEELLRIGLVIRGTVARRNFWSLCLPLQPIPLQKHLGRAQSIFAVDVRRGAEPRTSQLDISPCPCKR